MPRAKRLLDGHIAERYDADSAEMFDPAVVDPAVSFLADLAGDGDALELGIGMGRIASPLSHRGVRVHGIELSPAMLARLKTKPGADDIGVTVGNFATTRVDGMFRLAYLVFTGMTLRERRSGWKREPFPSDGTSHVSVWEKRA